MSLDINSNNTSASPILAPRTISSSEGLSEFNALFNNNEEAADAAAAKLKANWSQWAAAFDSQWFQPTENNAKILTGKKIAEEAESAKMQVAEVIKKALNGEQVSTPANLPTNPANNTQALVAFNSIFKSPQVADKQAEKLVANWERWATAFGVQGLEANANNAKIVAGSAIAQAMTDARNNVANAIHEVIDGKQISFISATPNVLEDHAVETFRQNISTINTQDQLEQARDRTQVYKQFLTTALNMGANANNLVFLYRGVQKSPYKQEVKNYPTRLKEKPDNQNVVSYGDTIVLKGSNKKVTFSPYPKIGELPQIDKQGLDFLHPDIKEACVCVGSFVEGNLKAHWLGRNALTKGQFWSGTKILPILNVISKLNAKAYDSDIDNCVIRDANRRAKNFSFNDLAIDVVSYGDNIASSNSLAAMFKRFETRSGLENWVQKITGNTSLEFRGGYGEPAFINQPELFDIKKAKVLLSAPSDSASGNNLVSPYDMVRFISMLGWHHHISQEARLPGAQWHSLESIVRAMGTDAARYTDLAIKTLGLEGVISSPVIISKLGNGYSSARKRYEIVYIALVQFVDERSHSDGKPAKLRTVSMALRGATSGDAVKLDARMATEVTEIFRRVVTEELA